MAVTSSGVSNSPSHRVGTTTPTTGVVSNPSEICDGRQVPARWRDALDWGTRPPGAAC